MAEQRDWLQDLVDDFIDCVLEHTTAKKGLARIPVGSRPHDDRPPPQGDRA